MAADFLVLGVELAPDSPDGYRLLLGHLKRNEDVFMRLKYLHRALKLEPDDLDYNRALAEIYLSLQVRLDDAHAAATHLLRIQPGPESQKLVEVSADMPQIGPGNDETEAEESETGETGTLPGVASE